METEAPFILLCLLVGTFWVGVYCWILYRLGRWLANRYRVRPVPVFAIITIFAAFLSCIGFVLPVDSIWKAVIVFSIWITHTQAIASGFWGGMELGRRSDEDAFKRRTDKWLSEWERPVTKHNREDAD
jgi:hypothetical protein